MAGSLTVLGNRLVPALQFSWFSHWGILGEQKPCSQLLEECGVLLRLSYFTPVSLIPSLVLGRAVWGDLMVPQSSVDWLWSGVGKVVDE